LFLGVVGFFEIQFVLGIVGTDRLKRSLVKHERHSFLLLQNISVPFADAYHARSPVPEGLFGAMDIMRLTLFVNAVRWPIAALVVGIYAHYGKAVGGVLDMTL